MNRSAIHNIIFVHRFFFVPSLNIKEEMNDPSFNIIPTTEQYRYRGE